MDTFWNRKRKKKEKNQRRKETNDILTRDRIIRDITTLFEQQEEKAYYKPKRVSNFWNNYIYTKTMVIEIEIYRWTNISIKWNLTWGI